MSNFKVKFENILADMEYMFHDEYGPNFEKQAEMFETIAEDAKSYASEIRKLMD